MAEGKSKREKIVKELVRSYNAELETVLNYTANAIHLDGVRATQIKESLTAEIADELMHAQQLGERIKTLFGAVPGSMSLKMEQASLQPPADTTDVVAVIKGVIEAEDGAVRQYRKIIELTDGVDMVTQDLCIQLLGDEENHRRVFLGFLKEYEDVSELIDRLA